MNISVKTIIRFSVGTVLIAGLSACANMPPEPMSNSPLTGPVNTGTYPVFTPDPKGETAQFTPQEKDAVHKKLVAAKSGQGNATADPAAVARRQAEMKKLVQQQQDDLKAIEGSQ
ncbi:MULTISPECIES: hypothetical protein [unclassified Phyllobacterium]|uniref:hypothetical protein n=1 Tax=Phyllobacterium TaxID=28100 RepID=UPI000DDB1B2D|nr:MULTISPECIES: hypothetical protein [unclassified Phyllobacterium]MBA8902438.1 acyl-CoA reductase-like NAD-dependent aldehyde dehydrogenase [Phyllobacterium sp. P30BS-XVII]UGX87210.1 hypothetical protein LLE53_005060 [Phyllobacterium sp. T1293]